MADNFDMTKFLKENHLGSYGILGKYVDLHGLNEASDIDGLKLVKGAGTLRNKEAAEAIAKVAKNMGMKGVKVIQKAPNHFSVYAEPDKKLSEAEYADGEDNQYDGKYDDEYGPAIANEAEDSFIQAQRDAAGEFDGDDEDSFMQAQGDVASDFESEDHNRMMGLIDQNLFPQLPKLKKAVDLARAKGLQDQAIFNMLSSNSLVGKSVSDLIDDGFDPQDIVDFFGSDFSMEEEGGSSLYEALDIRTVAKTLIDAVKAGKDVTIKGKAIVKVVPPMGIFIAADDTKFKMSDLIAQDDLDTIAIDGQTIGTPEMKPERPNVTTQSADWQDRFGPGGGYQTGAGKYTGD